MPRRPGAKAVVAYQGKILLVLHDNNPAIASPNTWNTPGGGIEVDETPEEALVRELKEEVNLSPSCVVSLGTTTYTDGSVVYRFYVPVTDEEFQTIHLISEGQHMGWFTLEEALHLDLSPYSRLYYATHQEEIQRLLSEHTVPAAKDEIINIT